MKAMIELRALRLLNFQKQVKQHFIQSTTPVVFFTCVTNFLHYLKKDTQMLKFRTFCMYYIFIVTHAFFCVFFGQILQ